MGWASLAVGAIELLATRWLEKSIGVDRHGALIKSYGVREVVAGLTILNQPGLNKTLAAGLWGRVVGDAADLATLAIAGKESRKPEGLATIASIVLGVTLADLAVAALAQHDLPEDCYDAFRYVYDHPAQFNGKAGKVAVAGESAGRNLATVVCLMAKMRGGHMPVHQVLIYPVTNCAFDDDSYHRNAMAKPLDAAMMQWFSNQSKRRPERFSLTPEGNRRSIARTATSHSGH